VKKSDRRLKTGCILSPKECFEWAILREADLKKKMILQRAFQEIEHEIRKSCVAAN